LQNTLNILYRTHQLTSKALRVALTLALAAGLGTLLIVHSLRDGVVSTTPLMVINQKATKVQPQRKWISVDSISPEVIRAVISTEDNNFFYHKGFDIEAIKWALKRNEEQSQKTYGASTISQQTAKNVFLPPARTWTRKACEAGFTLLIEALWSKARIMEVYLNVIEMGKNVYGIEAAAQHHFNKSAKNLTKYESVMIAIALPSPQRFNPAKPSPYMISRQEQVYEVMEKTMETGWYKNIRNIKFVKVNYLEQ
jgi:monofunctional biosynthetic peptidoglycan transglycosylase